MQNTRDMVKSEIRRRMRALNRAVAPDERREASLRLLRAVEATAAWRTARCVALFWALPDEPDTAAWPARWAATGRCVALPRVEGDAMRFYAYDPAALAEGAYGITEPQRGEEVAPERIDLVVCPGVAFTRDGRRLGRGKGYYDRWLARPGVRAVKTGICYPHQIVGDLPAEPHDIRMDEVLF